MAKVKLPYNAAISTEQVRNVLEQTIGSRYEIRPSPAPTVDWWVVSGAFKAAAVKLKQEPSTETVIRVNGSPP